MHGYRTFARLCGLAVVMALAAGSAQASVIYWNGSGSNDSTLWGSLGANGTTIPSPFSATSAKGNAITGSFAGGVGQTAVVGTGWTPVPPSGFASSDTLVWTLDNTTGVGAGPLTLGFGTAVLAGGLFLDADAPGQFDAQVQAFDGATSLGTASITSDTTGDPVFIGAIDTTADITSLVFSMTSCAVGCDPNDFAVDTLLSQNPSKPPPPPVPEPASVWLFAGALASLGLVTLRRRQRL